MSCHVRVCQMKQEVYMHMQRTYVHWKVTREIRDGTMVCPQGSLPTTDAIQVNSCLGLKLMMCLGSIVINWKVSRLGSCRGVECKVSHSIRASSMEVTTDHLTPQVTSPLRSSLAWKDWTSFACHCHKWHSYYSDRTDSYWLPLSCPATHLNWISSSVWV